MATIKETQVYTDSSDEAADVDRLGSLEVPGVDEQMAMALAGREEDGDEGKPVEQASGSACKSLWVSCTKQISGHKGEDRWRTSHYGAESLGMQTGYFGVFDGHGGHAAADHAAGELQDYVWAGFKRYCTQRNAAIGSTGLEVAAFVPLEAFADAFLCMDGLVKAACHSGTTASVVVLRHLKGSSSDPHGETALSMAWAGDSRIVVVDGQTGKVRRVSKDHSTYNLVEVRRVKEEEEEGLRSQQDEWGSKEKSVVGRLLDAKGEEMGPLRVFSPDTGTSTVVTRSIGDRTASSAVVAEPSYLSEVLLGDESATVVICSDGVWDSLSNDEVAGIVNSHATASEIAGAIVKKARLTRANRGLRMDDITATVVLVHPENPRFRDPGSLGVCASCSIV